MTHKTNGIVLRSIKYGETSLVVTIFTELFGVQTYMVNGARTNKKTAKAFLYQPAAILELDVYHNDLKKMHRIREANWGFLYSTILSDVIKNSIALYMVELLYKILKQPEHNTDMYHFSEDALKHLDHASNNIAANFPLYFSLHLAHFLGFKISNPYRRPDAGKIYIDLVEGIFTDQQPAHQHFIEGENALITSELLKVMQPGELDEVKLNHLKRRELLLNYQDYYALHIQDFGEMKTLKILQEVLG
ncbi:MAG TPA: DNA repair protein RecO [Ferruginibacter sp.]|nr:DNA repair protein RecO [Ferruginibacter sp.]